MTTLQSTQTAVTPLYITPLVSHPREKPAVGRYETLQRLVTAMPGTEADITGNDTTAEIETAIEVYVGPKNNTTSPLWKRVIVRSGPLCPNPVVHASFPLSDITAMDNDDNYHFEYVHDQQRASRGNALCWTVFEGSTDRPLLCVLANPTLLCIFDVYPNEDQPIVGEGGHTIPLPFEAASIHSLMGNQHYGLLIQRLETVDDQFEQQGWDERGIFEQEEDDGFVLQPPPTSMNATGQARTTIGEGTSDIPSLFSLSHPFDDVLPISNFPQSEMAVGQSSSLPPPVMITDVFEKVLYVGELSGIDSDNDSWDRKPIRQTICVTYHTQHKRHTIWEIETAPVPPPQAPLWQVSSQWRSDRNSWSSHIGMLEQDFDDMDIIGGSTGRESDVTSYDLNATRNDALADALGIRKTPRKAMVADESAVSRGRGARSAPRSQARKANTNVNTINNNASLLSPSGRHPNNTTLDSGHSMMDTETTVDLTNRPPLLTMGPFASLFPKMSMKQLHQDAKQCNEATRIFVASNLDASGRTIVCLLCPGMRKQENGNANVLRLLSFGLNRNLSISNADFLDKSARKFTLVEETDISCITAIQIEASPVAPQFYTRPIHSIDNWSNSSTDIFLLHDQNGKQRSTLYRANIPIVDCQIMANNNEKYEWMTRANVLRVDNSIHDRLDIVLHNQAKEDVTVRVNVSIEMSDHTTEMILGAFESCIYSMTNMDLKAKTELTTRLRSDAVRLSQSLASVGFENPGLSAIEAILVVLFRSEMKEFSREEDHFKETDKKFEASSSWQQLLSTDFHRSNDFLLECDSMNTVCAASMNMLKQLSPSTLSYIEENRIHVAKAIFHSLHLLYEDFKLNCASRETSLSSIGTILVRLCSEMTTIDDPFVEHYRRDLGDDDWCTKFKRLSWQDAPMIDVGQPFCIYSWFDALLSNSQNEEEATLRVSDINAACSRIRMCIRIFKALYDSRVGDSITRDISVVRLLLREGIKDQESLLGHFPTGIALPILEVLNRCRCSGRLQDLETQDPDVWSLLGRDDLQSDDNDLKSLKENIDDKDIDGLSALEEESSMLFPDDNRIREVCRLLRSAKPMYLNVPRGIEVSDHDYERMKQEKLMLLSRRTLALPLGRGMLTIGSLRPVPAEPLPLPEMCLVGRLPPTDAMLALDTTECPADLKVWPEFNNGVAAGLRLPLQKDGKESVSKITRTWIVYNGPGNHLSQSQNQQTTDLGHSHGGLLMALGLRGHLTTLEMTDIFDYLTQGSVTTTVGVLLGMGANMRGSCDMSVSKMLCLHIPSLIPQHFSSIDVSSAVQAAAISGAGLLYEGSSHRMMTEFLLNEIGKRPSNDINVVDREAYSLSCGIALGMVNLAQGNEHVNAGLADIRLEERLHRYVIGGLDDSELRRKREEGDRLSLPTTSNSSNGERCSCVFEGDSINTDITAPGATLALGLIYMKSENDTIASSIALPETHFLLEYVRPDFLMLRVIARSLILWKKVAPTSSWISSQVPLAVFEAYTYMRQQAECLAKNRKTDSSKRLREVDTKAVRSIYVHVIAGACFSIGLRYAGTGNRKAVESVFERVMELTALRDGTDPVACALRPQSQVLEMCLGCCALSLAMILAGSGDLDVLRLLKVLRWRCDEDINYGSHMAFGTAIGLLFLGGGTSTIGREPQDIASLLLAFYPRFPSSASDNQYHLQALRHLYALAVKKRDIQAIDIDTKQRVFVPVEIHYEGNRFPPTQLRAPCLRLNSDIHAKSVRVRSDRYYPVTREISENSGAMTIFVKRRSAHLSYEQDPESRRSLLVQTGNAHGQNLLDLVASFTGDKSILSFAKHFCSIGQHGVTKAQVSSHPFATEGLFRRVLFESLVLDTTEVLPLYLALRGAIECIGFRKECCLSVCWDLRLIQQYYRFRDELVSEKSTKLFSAEVIAFFYETLERKCYGLSVNSNDTECATNIALSILHRTSLQDATSMDTS